MSYKEELHPLTGDVMWRFDCSGLEALVLIPNFLTTYPHKDYTLAVHDELTNDSKIEILDVPFDDIPKIIGFIHDQEHAGHISWIGVNSLSDSYVVCMPLARGRVSGRYRVVDGKLQFVNDLKD